MNDGSDELLNYLPRLHLRRRRFFAKFFHMAQNRDKLATDLQAISEKLARIAEALREKNTQIAVSKDILDAVAEKRAAGKCLQCEEVKKETYRRGICAACYRKTKVQMEKHETSWEILESRGLAVPKNQGRRGKETALDRLIAEKKTADASAALAAELAKRRGRRQ